MILQIPVVRFLHVKNVCSKFELQHEVLIRKFKNVNNCDIGGSMFALIKV